MERSQAGFRRVFSAHHAAVYGYCLRRTDSDDALDAAADVFLTAWRCMEDMPCGEAELPWLYAVARRVLSRQWRGRRRRRRLRARAKALASPVADGPEAIVVRREEYELVCDALDRLRATDREVLRLAAWDELPHATIAALLGCSINAVDQRLSRARRRLASQYWSLARHRRPSQAAAPSTERGGEA